MSVVKLANEFFKVLLEESLKDEAVLGDDEPLILRAVLTAGPVEGAGPGKKRHVWTMRVRQGRLESVSETIEDGHVQEDPSVLSKLPTVSSDEKTINELLSRSITPLRAFMRGSIRLTGDRDSWRILAEPGKRAIARLKPLVDAEMPFPTFAEIDFVSRGSNKWTPNLPHCQLCGTAFGLVFSRPHHCRVCGKVVCAECSPHSLAGHRACESCFLELAVDHKSKNSSTGKPINAAGSSSSSSRKIETPVVPAHEKGHGSTALGRALDTIRINEESSPITCVKAESRTEHLLRSSAMSTLQETRSLRKELNELKAKGVSTRSLLKHALMLGTFFLCWRSSSTSSLAWYILVGFSSFWKHSIAGWALSAALTPVYPLASLTLLRSSSPYSLAIALFLGLSQTVLLRMFERLLRIYSTSFAIIVLYQGVKVACDRFLKLDDKAKSSIFDRVDTIVAPWACDEVLSLKSVFVKFGQYLGARSDVVPPSWSAVLAKLQDDMPFDSVSYVSRLLKDEGLDVNVEFDDFDFVPVASASIAQVHRGKLKNGERVAVKIQHERVEDMMRGDMKAFKRIMDFIVWLNPRFEIASQLLEAWEVEMLKELDFRTEASNLMRVKRACSRLKDVIVPDHIKCTKRVLIIKWVDGFKLTDMPLLDLNGVDREALLKRCVQAYSYQIFVDGFFQADPHAGNLFVQIGNSSPSSSESRSNANLVLLDFGMCVTLPDEVRVGYCELLVALSHLSVSELSRAIAKAGYENSQSSLTPERDLEFFMFLLRDTGSREDARKESKEFSAMRKEQRNLDKDKEDAPQEGRYFKRMPDSLLFLMRTLGLLRGLCTTLNTPTSYLENMVDYAKLALITKSLERLNEQEEEEKHLKKMRMLRHTALERAIAKSILDHEIEGGYQICVMQQGELLVDLSGGSLWDCDVRQCLPETLFPLCDLSKALCSLAALYALSDGTLDLDQPLLGPQSVGATVREALAHHATGMESAVSSSAFGHVLRADYDKLLLKVGKEAALTSSKTKKSAFHTQSLGYELDLALRNSRTGLTLKEQVNKRVLSFQSIPSESGNEVIFGGLGQENAADEDDGSRAKVSHGYSEAIRMAMAAGNVSAGGDSTEYKSSGGMPSLSDLRELPGRVVPDAAMVNDPLTRQANLPSFGAFGTAKGMCKALDQAMKTIPLRFWHEKVAHIEGEENNTLFGRLEWGLGFVVHRSGSAVMLSHHSFGGSHLVFVPEKRIAAVVLVSHLTIERELSTNVLRLLSEHLSLPSSITLPA